MVPSSADCQKDNVERGATMLEFAIALPVVLFILFAIMDLSIISTSQILLAQALHRSGAVAARQSESSWSDCKAGAQDAFARQLSQYGFFGGIATAKASFDYENSSNPRAVLATVQAKITCFMFCGLLLNHKPGAGASGVNFSLRAYYLIEDPQKCAHV